MGAREFSHKIGWNQFDELPQHRSMATARLFRGFLFHTLPPGRKNPGSRATLSLPLWDGCGIGLSLRRHHNARFTRTLLARALVGAPFGPSLPPAFPAFIAPMPRADFCGEFGACRHALRRGS